MTRALFIKLNLVLGPVIQLLDDLKHSTLSTHTYLSSAKPDPEPSAPVVSPQKSQSPVPVVSPTPQKSHSPMPQKSSPSPPPTKSLSKSSDKKLVESIVKDIERKNEKKPPRPQPTLPKEDVHNGKLKLLVYDNFLKYF